MGRAQKMRMCPYCEGTVPLESISCRFCGSSFEEQPDQMERGFTKDTQNTYYNPPYTPGGAIFSDSVFKPENKEAAKASVYEDTNEEEEKGHILALTLLSVGGMFLTLSFLLFFFSEHGRVILEWKSRYWSLYMIIAVPLLYYGFKKLRKL